MNSIRALLPIVRTLEGYRPDDLRADAIAGLTTAVMLVPQAMAYAMLAGLPPIHGVYAALVPGIVYALLGTSRQLSVGPVAMDSLLVFAGLGAIAEAQSEAYVAAAVLLALMVGALQVLMGLLKTGFLVNFLSAPVISGFTSAAALIIGLSQAKHLLGVSVDGGASLPVLLPELIDAIPQTSLWTLMIGMTAILVIVVMKKWKPSAPRALLAVGLGAGAVVALGLHGEVAVVGSVPAGLPSAQLPTFRLGLVEQLLPTAVTIALVSFLESISVGKVYAQKHKYRLNPDRELVAVGLGNAAVSFFGGYPVAGGFSRTAVNADAGARTPVATLITSAIVGLSLLFLTPLFYFLPKTALAAIIVTGVAGLMDFQEVQHLSRVKKADMALLVTTFISTLALGILPGIGVGVAASIVWFVVRTMRPHIAELGRVPGTKLFRNVRRHRGLITYEGVIMLRMDAQFYFGNIAFLRSTLERLEDRIAEPLTAVVLDFSAINNLDSTALSALVDMHSQYDARGVHLYLTGVKGPVRDVLQESGLLDELGRRALCLTVYEAISLIDPVPRGEGSGPTSVPPAGTGIRASGASARL